MSVILTCRGCGATKPAPDGTPTDHHPSDHCGQCPPWQCETCGEMCSAAALCSCWLRIEDLTLADVKALFATIDLGVSLRPTTSGDSDA